MKTITIEIGALDANCNAYPVTLREHDDGKVTGPEYIPGSLQLPGQRFDSKAIRDEWGGRGLPRLKEIGDQFFELLSQGRIALRWKELRDQTKPLRTCLSIQDADVGKLPWELLRIDEIPIFLNPHQSVWRKAPFQPAAVNGVSSWPIRVLLVVGAKENDPDVKAEAEVTDVLRAARPLNRRLDIEVIYRKTRTELLKIYREFLPHIFHFVGHSRYLAEDKGLPALEIISPVPGTRAEYWKKDDLATDLLGAEWSPRLAILNACRTGAADASVILGAGSIADVFLKRGTPAVIAMQADVKGDLAGKFAASLYRAFANGKSIEEAVYEARKAVFDVVGSDRPDWAFPHFTLSTEPEEVLQMRPQTETERSKEIGRCPTFGVLDHFVDRIDERRKILWSFHPITDRDPEHRLLVLVGDKEVGKTTIAHWCMEGCAQQDYEVWYVEVAGAKETDWLTVLRQIRTGDPTQADSIIHSRRPEHQLAFDQFNWGLNARLHGMEPPPWPNNPTSDKGVLLKDAQPTPDLVSQTFLAFRDALERTAKSKPLIIVLDKFEKSLSEGDFKLLRDELGSFVADGKVKNVRMVFVLHEDEYELYKMAELKHKSAKIPIGKLSRAHFLPLALEYFDCRREELKLPPAVYQQLSQAVAAARMTNLPDPWLIGELERVFLSAHKLVLG